MEGPLYSHCKYPPGPLAPWPPLPSLPTRGAKPGAGPNLSLGKKEREWEDLQTNKKTKNPKAAQHFLEKALQMKLKQLVIVVNL